MPLIVGHLCRQVIVGYGTTPGGSEAASGDSIPGGSFDMDGDIAVERNLGTQSTKALILGNAENKGISPEQQINRRTQGDLNPLSSCMAIQTNPCYEEDTDNLDLVDPKKRKRAADVHGEGSSHAKDQSEETTSVHFLTGSGAAENNDRIKLEL